VARNEASRATNGAVIVAENGISLWPATATVTTRTEYSVGTGNEKGIFSRHTEHDGTMPFFIYTEPEN
jgi:hypothetical protein